MRNDLVGVGVGRRTGASLENIQHELVVERAGRAGHLVGGFGDGFGLVCVQNAELAIRACRGGFEGAQRPDEASVEAFPADGKVLDGALRGGTVIRALGYLELAHRIAFNAPWWNGTPGA